jgi:hypothetical protein
MYILYNYYIILYKGCYGLNMKYPPQLMGWVLGPQQVALFWEVMETLGGGV